MGNVAVNTIDAHPSTTKLHHNLVVTLGCKTSQLIELRRGIQSIVSQAMLVKTKHCVIFIILAPAQYGLEAKLDIHTMDTIKYVTTKS